MSESKKKVSTPSHTELKCKQCSLKVQKRSLADHYSKFHKEADYKESLINEKNYLENFLGMKRPSSDKADENKQGKSPKIVDSEDKTPNRTSDTTGEDQSNQPSTSANICINVDKSGESDLSKVLSRINTLEANQKKMLNKLKNNSQKPEKKNLNKPKQSDMACVSMKQITNVDELISGVDWLVSCEDNNFIRCMLCFESENVVDITARGVFNTNQEFRYLKSAVKRHESKPSHIENLKKLSAEKSLNLKLIKKNEVIGYRLGSIAYQIIFHSEAFSSYPRKIALLAQNGIDVGSTNHSKAFPATFITPLKNQISLKLKERVKQPLACTGKPPPIALINDKASIKHEERHGICVRFPIFAGGELFKTFLLGQPVQTSSTRDAMCETLIQTTRRELDLTLPELREQMVCECADGAIVKNIAIWKALMTKLSLGEEYAKSLTIWDLGHLLELALDDTKKEQKWLQDFDSIVQKIMVFMRQDYKRTELKKVCTEKSLQYCELVLFSTTRFAQYMFRSYKSLRDMWLAIWYLLENISASDTKEAIEAQKGFKSDIQNPKFVIRLVFMEEISNIVTILSKQFQKRDVLPFFSKQAAEKTIASLETALECFKKEEVPSTNDTLESGWQPWKKFSDAVKEVRSKCEYQGRFLLKEGEGESVGLRSKRKGKDITEILQETFKGKYFH